jgi:hypothetical protein
VVCWNSCDACPDEVTYYDLTFEVNTANIEVGPNGMFAGGGFLGGADAVALSDDDGDGIWSATISVLEGTSGNYVFLNSPNHGGDWGTKEDLAGQECADANNWNDRILQPVTENTTVSFCFGECTQDCPPPPSVFYDVTFNVNMQNEDVSADGVYLAGGVHFGWPGDNPMSDEDGDGIWSITVSLAEGTSGNYAFLNGNCGDWSCKEDLDGQDCADPANYNDRILAPVMGNTVLSTCFGQCSTDGTCEAPPAMYAVTFQVDMSQYEGGFGTVNLNGSFAGWCGGCIAMADDNGDGIYAVTVDLPADTIEYKFTLDGWTNQENFAEGESCTSTIDGFTNRSFAVEGDATLPVVCWESCDACPSLDVEGCIDATACNYDENATIQAFGDGSINLSWSSGLYGGEVQFAIEGTEIAGSVSTAGDYTLAPGIYTVSATDTYGDSWNGYELTITDAGTGQSFVIVNENLDGGLGAETQTFEITVTGASTCTYQTNPALDCDGNCLSGDLLTLTLTDAWGDSWNGNSLTIDGVVYDQPSTASGGASDSYAICIDLSVCHDVTYNLAEGNTYPEENSWTITDADGNELASGDYATGTESGVIGDCTGGCLDSTACNYNGDADYDDGSCEGIADGECDCDGNVLDALNVCGGTCAADADADGICDDIDDCVGAYDDCNVCNGDGTSCVISGCTDATACNYNDQATLDDGSCESESCAGCDGVPFSGVTLDDCGVCGGDNSSCTGCIDATACNYDENATIQEMVPGSTGSVTIEFPVTGAYTNEKIYGIADSEGTLLWGLFSGVFAGVETVDLAPGTYTIIVTDGYGDGWDGTVMTVTDVASGNTLDISEVTGNYNAGTFDEIPFEVTAGMVSTCDYASCSGCMDATACNYDDTALYDDGSCTFANDVVDCDGNCISGDQVILTLTDSWGDSWNGNSLTIDGVVYDQPSTGPSNTATSDSYAICIDLSVCHDVTYNLGEGNTYPGENSWTITDADGNELASGAYADGTADGTFGNCIGGCTDATACNYNSEANIDDASCEFESCAGCLDASACNYDETATISDVASCTYAQEYYDCAGVCLNDADGDGLCDELEVYGCVVPTACNYAEGVTELVPCIYPEQGYLCDGTCDGDADGDGVCDANEIVGCQDSSACDYDSAATDAGDCDYTSCQGCTDDTACNFDATATQDDGSCDYCSCASEAAGGQNGFNLSVETHEEGGIFGMTTYRVYVTTPNETDFLSAIAGDEDNPSYLRTSTSFYQNDLGGATADLINPLFFGAFPDLAYDSWLTIGIESAPMPGDGTAAPQLVQAEGDTWLADFEAGDNLEINSFFGGSWFTTNLVSNGVAGADKKVLVAQLTTDGTLTGQLYVQVFPEGVGANAEYLTLSFGSSSCGCTDEAACNYNDGAQHDDGSCFYNDPFYTCAGVCENDADGDGVCDELEIAGCQDAEACNYDAEATDDDGNCEYVEPTLLPGDAPACGLFFSGYAEGSSNNKFLEIYNPTDAAISLDGYAYPSVANAPSTPGEYEFWNNFDEGAEIAPGDVYIIAHGSADPAILAEADETHSYLSNGDDGYMLVMGTQDDFIQVDAIGDWNGDPGSGWDVAGVSAGTKDHSLIRKSDITSGNGGDWTASAGTDADNSEWIVLDQNDWTGLGSHDFTGSCGGGNYAIVYDCDDVCLNDTDGDGVCDELEIAGCTDSGACNYDSAATDDDSSCEYLTCAGCTDGTACNYDETATIEDGSCTYAVEFYDCDDNCLNDANMNGICDELEVLGCTYAAACNYDMAANVDDGQCDFSCLLTGCTDDSAVNYDEAATTDDGSCLFVGCTDPDGLDYDPTANYPGGCDYPEACPGDFTGDGEVDVNDLLDFFQLWGLHCE